MQNENFSAPEETPGGYNFGTFAGVYTPALLTILGLVMFMRTNFVLGNAGLFQTLLILLVGSSITLATGFSISAIATNTDVGGGGAYYLISRVLGPAFGTSIGLTLFVSQSLATSSVPPKRSSTAGRSCALTSRWSTSLSARFSSSSSGRGRTGRSGRSSSSWRCSACR